MNKTILLTTVILLNVFSTFSQSSNSGSLLEVTRSNDYRYGNNTAIEVNLTEEGTRDWFFCGRTTQQNVRVNTRKTDVFVRVIGEPYLVGGGQWRTYPAEPSTVCTWTDGDPVASATRADGGWWFRNADKPENGVAFPLVADTLLVRTVKFYCGRWGAGGKMNIRLSDNSAPAYTHTSGIGFSAHNCFTIRYRAATPNQTLIIEWRNSGEVNRDEGNIQMVALTVSEEAPSGVKQLQTATTNFDVFPNPVNDGNFNIKLKNMETPDGKVNISIMNVSGSVVYESVFVVSDVINLRPNLEKGAYFVKANTDVQKIMVQ